jgi:hypothetical protein
MQQLKKIMHSPKTAITTITLSVSIVMAEFKKAMQQHRPYKPQN